MASSSSRGVDPMAASKQHLTSEMLKREGIIAPNEQLETIYLNDDEIEQFMAKYLRDNPGTEVETRYINHPPIELTQNIEVRWLRPETPEIPPIIIKEIDDPNPAPTPPPLRIVQKTRPGYQQAVSDDPLVIREKPPMVAIPEPKYAYVQNVIKRQVPVVTAMTTATKTNQSTNSESTIGHSRAGVGACASASRGSRLEFEEQRSERDVMNYSYEGGGGVVGSMMDDDDDEDNNNNEDYNEEDYEEMLRRATTTLTHDEFSEDKFPHHHNHRSGGFRQPRTYEDEHQLRLYEEKLKKTLYEEYLLRLERERLERKLSKSGLLEERIRERSMSQDRLSHHHLRAGGGATGMSTVGSGHDTNNLDEQKYRQMLREQQEVRHHVIRERNTQSLEKESVQPVMIMMTGGTGATTTTATDDLVGGASDSTNNSREVCCNERASTGVGAIPSKQQQQQQSVSSSLQTSSYKNIKFTRVTDQTDLERLNSILNNPASKVLDSRDQVADYIAQTLLAADDNLVDSPTPTPPTAATEPPAVVPATPPPLTTNSPPTTNPDTVMIRIRPNNSSSNSSDMYFAVVKTDNERIQLVPKPPPLSLPPPQTVQQSQQQHQQRIFDKMISDGIDNINQLATSILKDEHYTNNRRIIQNNLIRDNSHIVESSQLPQPYLLQQYQKPAKFGDYVIFDPTADYNVNGTPPGYSMPIYYKPLTTTTSTNNKSYRNTSTSTPNNKSENTSLKNIYSHLNHHFSPLNNINNINSNNVNLNEKNCIYFSTRY